MAETYEIDFAVNITPKIKNDGLQASSDQYYMDDEIGKSLGGSGTSGGVDGTSAITASGDDVAGWALGVATYVTSNNGSIPSGSSHAIGIIKNTGRIFLSGTPTVLGAAVTKTAGKWTTAESITLSFGGGTKAVCTLYPGEAMVLPRWSAGACVVAHGSGTDYLAVEYALIK